jgi:hypothetical protein
MDRTHGCAEWGLQCYTTSPVILESGVVMPSPVHPYSEYGVALRTLRSARTWLGYLLLICVLAQVVGFLLMWATQQPYKGLHAKLEQPAKTGWDVLYEEYHRLRGATTRGDVDAANVKGASEFFPSSQQAARLNMREQWDRTYRMTVPVTQILSLMAVCSQVIVMFLTLLLILVAQAPGVVHVTRGLIWSILLLFIVFPWQHSIAPNFPFPGVVYSYQELLEYITPHVASDWPEKVYGYQKLLVYARFLLWPAASMLVLLVVSEKFRAGTMLAIGHPLQSMMQPRGMTSKLPAPLTPGTMGPKVV